MARVTKGIVNKQLAEALIAKRIEREEYELNHSLESTIGMAFDTARNTMGSINNIAIICRNKSEIKVIESLGEVEQAYADLIA